MKITLDMGAYIPTRAHKTDAGLDLYSPIDFIIPPGGSVTIDTGVHIQLPPDTVGLLKSKSGLNVNHGIIGEGVIDVGYTGAIRVKLYNLGRRRYKGKQGDKITQLLVLPCLFPSVEVVADLDETERGTNGFGSTGR